jgi:hypothetical protein
MATVAEKQIMDQLAQRLAVAYPGIAPEQVTQAVSEEFSRFEGRPIRDFIPLFVEKHATSRLSRLVAL